MGYIIISKSLENGFQQGSMLPKEVLRPSKSALERQHSKLHRVVQVPHRILRLALLSMLESPLIIKNTDTPLSTSDPAMGARPPLCTSSGQTWGISLKQGMTTIQPQAESLRKKSQSGGLGPR